MTPRELVTIGKCTCGHSRAAHEGSKLGGCAFCGCLEFQLDEIVQEVKPARRSSPGPSSTPPKQP
jgi:hypothetical protein